MLEAALLREVRAAQSDIHGQVLPSQWPHAMRLKRVQVSPRDHSPFIRLFGTCLTLATKYYEEHPFVNVDGFCYVNDDHFTVATYISKKDLVEGQLEVLRVLDHRLFVTEEDYGAAQQEIMQLALGLRSQPQA